MSADQVFALWLLGSFLVMVIGIALIAVTGRANNNQNDEELAESLYRASKAKRAQQDLPIMLRKQAD
jgi:hypothetical protein